MRNVQLMYGASSDQQTHNKLFVMIFVFHYYFCTFQHPVELYLVIHSLCVSGKFIIFYIIYLLDYLLPHAQTMKHISYLRRKCACRWRVRTITIICLYVSMHIPGLYFEPYTHTHTSLHIYLEKTFGLVVFMIFNRFCEDDSFCERETEHNTNIDERT